MDYYFQRYGDLELQRRMVSDRPRTDAFARAIASVIKKGDVVFDVGTGTGILAMLAARAGAAKVVAVDQSAIAQVAANLVKANGLADRVKILRGPAAEVELDEKADVLVSEWLGHLAFVEGMLDDVVASRDRNLRPGGRMIPASVRVFLAPVSDPVLFTYEGPGFWGRVVHGIDMSSLLRLELDQARAVQVRVEEAALLGDGRPLVNLDLARAGAGDWCQSGRVQYPVERDAVLNGFVGWFEAVLAPGVVLNTGPSQPETHWSQTYLPFPPRIVRAGELLDVAFALARDESEVRHVRLVLSLDDAQLNYLIE